MVSYSSGPVSSIFTQEECHKGSVCSEGIMGGARYRNKRAKQQDQKGRPSRFFDPNLDIFGQKGKSCRFQSWTGYKQFVHIMCLKRTTPRILQLERGRK